jgi:two-component system chemotaxis response regulator CheB
MRHELLVVCACVGARRELVRVLSKLPNTFALPVIALAQADGASPAEDWSEELRAHCALPIQAVEDKDPILPGHVHAAPAGYDLYVESHHFVLALPDTQGESPPSLGAVLESAADEYRAGVVAVVLGNRFEEGRVGAARVEALGGVVLWHWGRVPDDQLSFVSGLDAVDAAKGRRSS